MNTPPLTPGAKAILEARKGKPTPKPAPNPVGMPGPVRRPPPRLRY